MMIRILVKFLEHSVYLQLCNSSVKFNYCIMPPTYVTTFYTNNASLFAIVRGGARTFTNNIMMMMVMMMMYHVIHPQDQAMSFLYSVAVAGWGSVGARQGIKTSSLIIIIIIMMIIQDFLFSFAIKCVFLMYSLNI